MYGSLGKRMHDAMQEKEEEEEGVLIVIRTRRTRY